MGCGTRDPVAHGTRAEGPDDALAPTFCLLAASSLLPAPSRAQAPGRPADGWVGKRVITQFGAVLTDPRTGKLDDSGRAKSMTISGHDRADFRTYTVEHVNGNWLWLHDEKGSAEGWVDASWVVPFDQAVDFFTARIRANPTNATNYARRAATWKEMGELDMAIADLNEAIRLDPRNVVSYGNRGLAWKVSRSTTRPSPTTPRPYGSIRSLAGPTAHAATLGTP